MNPNEMLATIHRQEEEIARLKQEQNSYAEKYKKSLKSIGDIVNANKQIKAELDKLRERHALELQEYLNSNNIEFRKAYDNVLKDKSKLALALHTLELEVEKYKYTVSDLQNQITLYKDERANRIERESFTNISQPEKNKNDQQSLLNYEDQQHALARTNKRLEERIGELQLKLSNSQKVWKSKLENKQVEFLELKAQNRRQIEGQVDSLRRECNAFRMLNGELQSKVEALEQSKPNHVEDIYDWQNVLIKDLSIVKSSIEPLRSQIRELQDMNVKQKNQNVRDRAILQTRIMELEAQCTQLNDNCQNMKEKLMEAHKKVSQHQEVELDWQRLQEENRQLQTKVIVLESKDIALRSRNEEGLEERVHEFEERIQFLLQNKENFKDWREINIHQFLELKVYITDLNKKVNTLTASNQYSLKKYKSYKEKYANLVAETRSNQGVINQLSSKVVSYDRLVNRLNDELQRTMRAKEDEISAVNSKITKEGGQCEHLRKKLLLYKDRLEMHQKNSQQEIETLTLAYDTKIIGLNAKIDELKGLKESLELYRERNEQLSSKLSAKQAELNQRKFTPMKSSLMDEGGNRNTKDIITTLHKTLQSNDEMILRLQNELRGKDESIRSKTNALENEVDILKEQLARVKSRQQLERTLQSDAEIRTQRNRIAELENELFAEKHSFKVEESARKIQQLTQRCTRFETSLKQAESKIETEVANRRKLQKHLLELNSEKEALNSTAAETTRKLNGTKVLALQIEELKEKLSQLSKKQGKLAYYETELDNKNIQIRKLSAEIMELKGLNNQIFERDIQISSLRNEGQYQLRNVEELTETLRRQNTEIRELKEQLGGNKKNYLGQFEIAAEEKNMALARLKKQNSLKEESLNELETLRLSNEDTIRKLKNEISDLRREYQFTGENFGRINAENLQNKGTIFEQEMTISTLRNEVMALKREIESLKTMLDECKAELNSVHGTLQATRSVASQQQFKNEQDKELLVTRLKREITMKDTKIKEIEEEINLKQEAIRRLSRQVLGGQFKDGQMQRLTEVIREKQNLISRLRHEATMSEEEREVRERQLSEAKENNQKLNYDMLDKDEALGRLTMEVNSLRNSIRQMVSRREHEEELSEKDTLIQKFAYESNSLRTHHQSLTQEFGRNQEQLRRLQIELNSIRDTLRSREQQNEALQQRRSRLEAELSRAKSQVRNAQSEAEENEYHSSELLTRLRSQVTELRGKLSDFEDLLSAKDSLCNRLNGEVARLKGDISNLEEENEKKSSQINRMIYEVETIRENSLMEVGEKTTAMSRQTYELNSLKNKYRDLEEEMQERESQFGRTTMELNMMRNEKVLMEDDMEQKNIQISRLSSETNSLKTELVRLNDELLEKSQALNKAKQEVFSARLQISEQNYEEQAKTNQQIYSLKSQVDRANEEIASKDLEISRLQLQITSIKTSSASAYNTELEALREQLDSKHKLFLKLRFELETKNTQVNLLEEQIQTHDKNRTASYSTANLNDKSEQIESKNIQIARLTNELRGVRTEMEQLNEEISEKSQIINKLKQEIFTMKLQATEKASRDQAKMEQELYSLKTQNSNLSRDLSNKQMEINRLQVLVHTARLGTESSTSDQISLLRNQIDSKHREFMKLKYQLETKKNEVILLEERIVAQERNLRQANVAFQADRQKMDAEIEECFARERKMQYEIRKLQEQIEISQGREGDNSSEEMSAIKRYQQQIERIRQVNEQLMIELTRTKFKMSSMVSQEQRLEENLVIMSLLFAEIQSLRGRVQDTEEEVKSVRKSFIQMVGGTDQEVHTPRSSLAGEHNERNTIHSQVGSERKFRQPFQNSERRVDHTPQNGSAGGNIFPEPPAISLEMDQKGESPSFAKNDKHLQSSEIQLINQSFGANNPLLAHETKQAQGLIALNQIQYREDNTHSQTFRADVDISKQNQGQVNNSKEITQVQARNQTQISTQTQVQTQNTTQVLVQTSTISQTQIQNSTVQVEIRKHVQSQNQAQISIGNQSQSQVQTQNQASVQLQNQAQVQTQNQTPNQTQVQTQNQTQIQATATNTSSSAKQILNQVASNEARNQIQQSAIINQGNSSGVVVSGKSSNPFIQQSQHRQINFVHSDQRSTGVIYQAPRVQTTQAPLRISIGQYSPRKQINLIDSSHNRSSEQIAYPQHVSTTIIQHPSAAHFIQRSPSPPQGTQSSISSQNNIVDNQPMTQRIPVIHREVSQGQYNTNVRFSGSKEKRTDLSNNLGGNIQSIVRMNNVNANNFGGSIGGSSNQILFESRVQKVIYADNVAFSERPLTPSFPNTYYHEQAMVQSGSTYPASPQRTSQDQYSAIQPLPYATYGSTNMPTRRFEPISKNSNKDIQAEGQVQLRSPAPSQQNFTRTAFNFALNRVVTVQKITPQ